VTTLSKYFLDLNYVTGGIDVNKLNAFYDKIVALSSTRFPMQ